MAAGLVQLRGLRALPALWEQQPWQMSLEH